MLIGPQNLAVQVEEVRSRMKFSALAANRDPERITLIAVSKTQSAAACRAAASAGVQDFGENYLQEALGKIAELGDLNLRWHFIGRLQSNKTRAVAEHFHWVHSIDRFELAKRLSEQRPYHAAPLNLCIQVTLVPEPNKGGIDADAVESLVTKIMPLTGVKLRGLMCVPPPQPDLVQQQAIFARLKALFDDLNSRGANLDTLSMGMSNDFEAAIAAGSTQVRVGSAIFGPRTKETI